MLPAPAVRGHIRPRAFHAIVERIRADIFEGRRNLGDRLPSEHELAEQFNVSRPGVREALRVLESQGLVRIRHGYEGGVFVADGGLTPVLGALETLLQLNHIEVNELYEARTLFEPTIARLALERADGAMLRQLDDNVARAKAALAAGADVFAINLEFHAVLAQAAGNRILALVMRALLELLERLDRSTPTNRLISCKAVDDHAELLEAIRTRDVARAERRMAVHLRDLKGRFVRIQERKRGPRPEARKRVRREVVSVSRSS
jgi:DNA-binding FadR family transcriptional regulator